MVFLSCRVLGRYLVASVLGSAQAVEVVTGWMGDCPSNKPTLIIYSHFDCEFAVPQF